MKKIFALCLLACFCFGAPNKDMCSVFTSDTLQHQLVFSCAGGYLFLGKQQMLNTKGLPATCECVKNENTKTLYNIKTDKGIIEWGGGRVNGSLKISCCDFSNTFFAIILSMD